MHTYSFELPMWSAYMGWKIIESVDDLVILSKSFNFSVFWSYFYKKNSLDINR